MDTAMEQQKLEEMLDRAVREVTRRTAGVELFKTQEPPSGDLCTVYITFKNGFQSSLTLWGNISLLARMARSALREEHLTRQDLEDFSKEYFNILCGKIAALLFQATKVPARFSVPALYQGRFEPEGRSRQFVLTYTDGQREGVQLVHHVPNRRHDDNEAENLYERGD